MAKAQTEKKREVSIVERRLKSGSIFASSSKPVPIKDPHQWTVREVNSQLGSQHLREMQIDKGWTYLLPEDLAVDPFEIGYRVQDGRVVRGQHAELVLMKMPTADFQAVQRAKDAENRKNTFGAKAVKNAILRAAEREEDGARGAEFLNKAVQNVSVVDSRERVNLED